MKVVNIDGLRRSVSGGDAAVAVLAATPIFAMPTRVPRAQPAVVAQSARFMNDIHRPLAPTLRTAALPVASPPLYSASNQQATAFPAIQRRQVVGSLIALPMLSVMIAGTVWARSIPLHKQASASTASPIPATTVQTVSTAAAVPAQTPPPVVPAFDTAGLQKVVDDFSTGNAAPFGIVVTDLKTGTTVGTSANVGMTSASLYKLFVAAEIYRRIDSGALTFGSDVPPTTSNVTSCLNDMITWSDNTCALALGDMIGWGSQNAKLANLGFGNTSLAQPQSTSPGDIAVMLQRLYNGTLLSPASTEHFLSLLKQQKVNNRLPVGLPGGTAIAHKTGDLDGFVHDAGIVYGPKSTYIISVMSGPWSSPGSAPAAIADLSAKVYAFMNQ